MRPGSVSKSLTRSGMLLGYRGRYKDSLSLTDLIPAKSYESMCKSFLRKAYEWLKEDK